jgi:hypothetical protein
VKNRDGFVSNSSSSNFLILNPPELDTLADVSKYLGVEVTTENEKDLTKFKQDLNTAKKVIKRKEFVANFMSSLMYGNKIPFDFLMLDGNDDFWEEYGSQVRSFIYEELEDNEEINCLDDLNKMGNKEFDKLYDLLTSDTIIDFMFYMFTKLPKMIAHIDLFEAQHEDYNAKCEMENSMYRSIASCIYNKLKNANLLDNVKEIEYEDATHLKLERGEYFYNIDTIERFSNH